MNWKERICTNPNYCELLQMPILITHQLMEAWDRLEVHLYGKYLYKQLILMRT
ncbi:MAG: hypothetical protein K9W44_10190 [Candidatus Lokiarchaeota archaeon]|nr:hypothetical protein [Candidatus Harpocratesius repetitus]